MNLNPGPIVACSTCLQSNAGLAVLRLSGFESLDCLAAFFSISIHKFIPRKQVRTNLLDQSKNVLDDVLVTFFPAPFSFTGENVLELSVHGNVIHVERLLKHLCDYYQFTLAAPGEFTYRAFKNKKLDLSQVEGLDLLLSADTSFVFDQGLSQLTGELHQLYLDLHLSLKKLVASIELSIDFSDDVGEEQASKLLQESSAQVRRQLASLYSRCSAPIGSLLEPSIVFLGAPNAGKSTLFNYFVGHDRAIISASAGTTRDYLSESMSFDFGRIRLVDTAGIRNSADEIEQEGIKRSKQQINHAFVRVLVVNPLDGPSIDTTDNNIDLVIATHADQPGFIDAFSKLRKKHAGIPMVLWGQSDNVTGPMGADLFCGPMGAKNQLGSIGAIPYTNGPIEPEIYCGDPLRIISSLAELKYELLTKSSPILVSRQRELISKLYSEFKKFDESLLKTDDIAIISSELSIILNISQELIGVFSPDDVLHHIFNNFCIGK
tara:strand:- start:1356 stop:2828 length:1473 start_codon:yes stop_codon:yes gene_type:complete